MYIPVHLLPNQRCEAVFSPCGKYRFWLARDWGSFALFGVFLCHNPSAADALWIDRTTACCSNLAIHWNWRGFGIVNVIPFTSSHLASARAASIPAHISSRNDDWLRRARQLADIFIIATGADGHQQAISDIRRLSIRGPFHAIQQNKEEGYLHPSRVSDEASCPSPIPIQL